MRVFVNKPRKIWYSAKSGANEIQKLFTYKGAQKTARFETFTPPPPPPQRSHIRLRATYHRVVLLHSNWELHTRCRNTLKVKGESPWITLTNPNTVMSLCYSQLPTADYPCTLDIGLKKIAILVISNIWDRYRYTLCKHTWDSHWYTHIVYGQEQKTRSMSS